MQKKSANASAGPAAGSAKIVAGKSRAATTGGGRPDAFALPAAMNRLARAHGLGVEATDAALAREYGERPKPESLTLLAGELGAEFRPLRGELSTLVDRLPVIAVTRAAGAVIIHDRRGAGFDVERPSGRQIETAATLADELAGVHFGFRIGGAGAERIAARAAATSMRAKDANGGATPGGGKLLVELYGLLLNRHRGEMAQLIGAALLVNAFMLALPLYIMSVYDRVIPHTAFESLITLTVGISIVLVADLGLRYVKLKFIDAIGVKASRTLQLRLYRRLLFMPLAKRPQASAALVQAQQEIDSACMLAPEFLASLIADSALAIGILMMIAIIGGAVVAAPLAGCLVVAAAIFAGSWSARPASRRGAALRNVAAAQINETFESLAAVKANVAEHALLGKFEAIADAAGLTNHEARQRSRFSSQAATVIVQATVVATLVLGVVRIDAGLMSIGALAATTILVGRAVIPVSQLVDQFNRLWTLKSVLTPALTVLDAEEEKGGERDGGESRRVEGAISLRNVSYTHESADVTALSGVRIDIRPREKVGIIGKNGSGKSTLLHLVPRLYVPTEGSVLLDGFDARQFSARRIRQDVGLMSQETVLFNAPLKDNILLGAEDVSEDDFRRAASIAGVDRFARRHPKGYSMEVGPRGEFLSAGERQAVGLARTLVRARRILLLDEPTSMMDHTAEGLVIAALRREAADRTLIITTHRLRLLELVDRVIVLDSGRVVADGARDAVLAQFSQPAPAANSRAATGG